MVIQTLNELENSVDERGYRELGGINTGEIEFLHSFKERIYVLFEGLKQDELWEDNEGSDSLQKKFDLMLGFLQFQLALIDARIEIINKHFEEE